MINFKPLGNNVVIRLDEKAAKTDGGIIIPDSAQDTALLGEVVAVGRGTVTTSGKVIAPEVNVGDRVLIAKWAGNRTDSKKIDGKTDLTLIPESQILGVVYGP